MFILHGFFVDQWFFALQPPEYSPSRCRPCGQCLENHEPQTVSLFSPCITALGFCLCTAFQLCSCSPPPCLPVTSIDVFYFKLSALPAHRRGDAGVIKKPLWAPWSQHHSAAAGAAVPQVCPGSWEGPALQNY